MHGFINISYHDIRPEWTKWMLQIINSEHQQQKNQPSTSRLWNLDHIIGLIKRSILEDPDIEIDTSLEQPKP